MSKPKKCEHWWYGPATLARLVCILCGARRERD